MPKAIKKKSRKSIRPAKKTASKKRGSYLAGRSKKLNARISSGVLTVEIGIDTLAHSAVLAPFADQLLKEPGTSINIRAGGFAKDVLLELTGQAEDGSTLITRMLDRAFQLAFCNGSEYVSVTDPLAAVESTPEPELAAASETASIEPSDQDLATEEDLEAEPDVGSLAMTDTIDPEFDSLEGM